MERLHRIFFFFIFPVLFFFLEKKMLQTLNKQLVVRKVITSLYNVNNFEMFLVLTFSLSLQKHSPGFITICVSRKLL